MKTISCSHYVEHSFDSPLISIIVPVYKVEPYLRRCLDSVIQQTYRNLEIILIDDGSPDNCGAICDDYASRDSRIRVIHQKNGGLSAARNAGLDIATGDYIGFVDSDDFVSTDMFDSLVKAILRDSADMVICAYQEIRKEGLVPPPRWYLPMDASRNTNLIRKRLLADEYPSYVWNKLFKKSLFDGVRFSVGRTYEDFLLITVLCHKMHRISTIKESLYYYNCQNPGSITYVRERAVFLKEEYQFFYAVINRIKTIRAKGRFAIPSHLPEMAGNISWGFLRDNVVYAVLTDAQRAEISRFLEENHSYIKRKLQWFLFKHCRPVFNVYARYRFNAIRRRRQKEAAQIQ